jgi:hypothetical protein
MKIIKSSVRGDGGGFLTAKETNITLPFRKQYAKKHIPLKETTAYTRGKISGNGKHFLKEERYGYQYNLWAKIGNRVNSSESL